MRLSALSIPLLVACGDVVAPTDAGGDAALDVSEVSSDVAADRMLDVQSDAPLAFRRVFITSQTTVIYNFFSLGNADTICNVAAKNAGLGGSWIAWISSSTASASSRMDHGTIPYRLLDGTEIAVNWSQLTSGTLEHPINVNEHATQTAAQVITGTLPDGSANANNTCNDWSGNAPLSTTQMGDSTSTTQWTAMSGTPQSCQAGSGSFYCFEQ
jgi:hypothetical protein